MVGDHSHSRSDRLDSWETNLVAVLVVVLEAEDRAQVAAEDVAGEEADVLEEELVLDRLDPDWPLFR